MDDTIQTLSLLCRQLDSLISSGEGLSSEAIQKLEETRALAEQSVVNLRNFTRGLRPPILDDLGVVASVRRLMFDFADRTKINAEISVMGMEKRISRDAEVGLSGSARKHCGILNIMPPKLKM